MGFFDYRGEDGREVIGEAYELAAYTSTTFGTTVPDGWEELSARDLGVSSLNVDLYGYFTAPLTLGGQAKVLVKKAPNGSVEQIAVSFAATNDLFDIYDYTSMTLGTYNEAFDYLLDAVADYGRDHGVGGDDVIVTGYSLGGGATANLAADSRTASGGYYEDANFVTFGSPALENADNVYNFGFENDGVFRLDLFGAGESSTDNLVLFNDTYTGPFFGLLGTSIANFEMWDAHIDGFTYNEQIFSSIADSHFHDLMDKDSLVIVQNLSDFSRSTTWVEPLNKPTGNHNNDDAFIMGADEADRLRGDNGNDFLDGHAGNDTLNGRAGNDSLFGGTGNDNLTGGSGNDTFIFSAGFGDDTITDFNTSTDVIEFVGVFDNFNEVMANAYSAGFNSVVINDGGDSITLEGISLGELSANDFMFS